MGMVLGMNMELTIPVVSNWVNEYDSSMVLETISLLCDLCVTMYFARDVLSVER